MCKTPLLVWILDIYIKNSINDQSIDTKTRVKDSVAISLMRTSLYTALFLLSSQIKEIKRFS